MSNRLIAIGDLHAGAHDRRAWELILRVIQHMKPQKVLQIGDFGDWESLSMHARKAGVRRSYRADKAAVRTCFRELCDASGSAEITVVEGNHDERLSRYLAENASEMEDDDAFDPRSVFGLRNRDVWVPYRTGIHIGQVYYTHDVGHSGKNARQQNLDAVQQCVVTGHTHRGGISYGGNVMGSHYFALELGWVGDMKKFADKPYMHVAKMKDWQLGLGVVDYDTNWNLAWGQMCPIVKGRVSVDGRMFK